MPTTARSVRTFFVALAIAGAGLSLAGCSANDRPDDPKSSTSSADRLQDWSTKWAACMRGQGQDVPDPTDGGAQGATKVTDPAAFETADRACRKKLGEPPVAEQTPANEQQTSDKDLKREKCLRDNGIELPPAGVIPTSQPAPMPANADEIFRKCGYTAAGGGQ